MNANILFILEFTTLLHILKFPYGYFSASLKNKKGETDYRICFFKPSSV